MKSSQHYILIACAVLYRECYYCAAISENIIDIHLREQGLHDIGQTRMSATLQDEIDTLEVEKYDAILLGYGLCNNGINGLCSKIPLVIPRAHDCITLLLGSKEKYQEYFNNNPGTFYKSVGWIEQAKSHLSNPESTTSQMGLRTYQEYVEKYGQDNAKYLMEALHDELKNYSKLAYIDTHIGNFEHYKKQEKENAKQLGWQFEKLDGSTDLILSMMNGQWDDEKFLVVQPGKMVEPSYDSCIINQVNGCKKRTIC